ncbi:hypothetical protein DPEC_G00344140 [Dallia pectoralis]|uniref:Uncharacterized protein n=1 Tax=Dallia pectoralis TaxID=75939 RepID=A0ACC2F359_DALPE|nr:hypothetical protein DPEC_G00344140 [Dallia pectoralis]
MLLGLFNGLQTPSRCSESAFLSLSFFTRYPATFRPQSLSLMRSLLCWAVGCSSTLAPIDNLNYCYPAC